jgi:hypothetical protein
MGRSHLKARAMLLARAFFVSASAQLTQGASAMAPNGPTSTMPALPGPPQLIGEEACIALLFAPDVRPAPRTWRKWKKRRVIPFVKVGRLCFYNAGAVQKALEAKFTVQAR